ncbi:MAG: BREX system Lon protease-like protein BrxL [Candidatus Helarchaeota archaeon]
MNNSEEEKIDLEEKNNQYQEKILEIFGDAVINKELVKSTHVFDLPRYIFEWLLSKYADGGSLSPDKKRELYTLIEKHYPDPEKLEYYKYRILKDHENVHILNHYRVRLDARSGEYNIYFPFFASESSHIAISEQIVKENKGLLLNGLWGIASIGYDPNSLNRPFSIDEFSPVQIEEVHLDEYIRARSAFTLSEWMELLINTTGLNPTGFPTLEKKIYLLTRLIPYVEKNYNLIEMGPKGTGKSFFHKNISTHVHVIGGGTISRAQLFYHISKRQKGLILTNDVVVFDDFSNIEIKGANEVIGKLKNYMADGVVDVGSYKESSKSSVVIMGNIRIGRDGFPYDDFYFYNLPRPMQESAFLDRLCAFIPGWKLHPIRPKDLSNNYGLIGDWFSEILHSLRKKSFIPEIEENLQFNGYKIRQRDINYMKATASGLIKILYPDGILDEEDWRIVGQYTVDFRQRVLEQLANIDPEYRKITVEYEILP